MMRWIDVIKYAKYGNPEPSRKVVRTEEEWRQLLTSAQYDVMRKKGTEPPYRNAYCRSYEPGVYTCVACGEVLFNSTEKYHAISGWPSFTQATSKSVVKYTFDDNHNMQRIEVLCNVCDSHLGHVFNDGPAPGGLRYCINSISLLRLNPEEE